MIDGLIQTFAASLFAGGLTGGLTVAAMRVHIQYLRQHVERAHVRLDELDRRLDLTREMVLQGRPDR